MQNKKWVFPAVTVTIVALAGIVLYSSGKILLPAAAAFALACLFDPPVGYLQRKGLNRALSVLTVLLATSLVAFCAGLFFVSSIAGEYQSVEVNLPEYAGRLYGIIPEEAKQYLGIETPEKAYRQMQALLEQLRGISFDVARETFSFLKQAVTSTLAFVLSILGYVVLPLYLYYFLKDMPRIHEGIVALVPERHRPTLLSKTGQIRDILSGFVRGQLTVCAVLAVLYSAGLLVIGIDLAVVIGSLSGVLFIVPYLGTLFGIVFSMLMAALKFHDFLHPLLCLGWFALVQALEGAVITPKIVGDSVGLHPVVTIIALLVAGQLFGIMGMLLAVPLTAVLKVFLSSYLSCYRTTRFFSAQ
jgi:predicted PurR-regulated permease PerM